LDKVATLLPQQSQVVFRADRGCADTHLIVHLKKLDWHWRIRMKSSFWIYRCGRRPCKVSRIAVSPGEATFWHDVDMTAKRYGPLHLALAGRHDGTEYGVVVSDEPTDMKTFEEYGWRFDIEENFLDDQSNGFQ